MELNNGKSVGYTSQESQKRRVLDFDNNLSSVETKSSELYLPEVHGNLTRLSLLSSRTQ